MLIFDIGAYKGEYTDRYLLEGAQVVAVEPQIVHARLLQSKYTNKPVTVIQSAIGCEVGSAMLYQTKASWLSSLNPERWKNGRFKEYDWHPAYRVSVTTLDSLIDKFGVPDFIKIDVEGSEIEAILGLTRPVPFLSFEFTRELLDDTERCTRHLLGIAGYEFSISYGMADKPNEYLSADKMMLILRSDNTPLLWGNIYARLING